LQYEVSGIFGLVRQYQYMAPNDDHRLTSSRRPGTLAWLRDILDQRTDLLDRIEHGSKEDQTRAKLLAGVFASTLKYRASDDPDNTAQSYTALRTKMSRVVTDQHHQTSHSRIPTHYHAMWYSIAVCLIAIAGIAIGLQANPTWLHDWLHNPTPVMTTYATGNGQRASITLADGTTVALDVASRLEVPADYPNGNRVLRLRGAALFTVTHHDRNPLTVISGSTQARVLGTSFVVRHYAADTATIVAVREGKVAVRSVVVTATQQVVVSRAGTVHVHPADPSQFSFAKGILTLRGVPFSAAIAELDRWYDADIRLGDSSLAVRHVAGEYAAGSLSDLANILALTFNVHVVRNGRVLTLYPQ
jgi:ferric-dicitrate binding protein FerR (iron transport regulator)